VHYVRAGEDRHHPAARLRAIRKCEAVLIALVEEGFLARTRDGAFISTVGRES
jgi:hypothetical protein